ncbi:alpha/beta fold hydrolase [Marinoscillum sp.]|uniref:bifunctional alpha/beta hydrolase/OsmC family protein n=1 Tax=Marinoscillum sp. TaxID=2024838 RepID=UPI003BAB74C4
MRSQKISFDNNEGKKLSGIIDFPLIGQPKCYAIFAHCFTCSKNLKAVDNIAAALTQTGIAVLRFDFTGLGQSEGDFEETNFSSNLSDLKDAYDFLSKNFQPPKIMIGHSLGGAAVLHVSSKLQEVQAVVTIGAPADPEHVKRLFKDSQQSIEDAGVAEVNIGGRPFKIKKQLLDDLSEKNSKEVIHELDRALLILHSPQDNIVGIENAAEIYDAAMHPKSFISLDGADHLMSDIGDSEYVGSIISPWAKRYVDFDEEQNLAPEGEVWTRLSGNDFVTEITAGQHQLIADEPEGSGGTDLGPSPYGYLLSALGACTAMTLRMYANYKKLKLEEVEVRLTHDKIHVEDGEQSESAKGKIDQIKRIIHLEGDLTADERKRLVEIAEKCPVHKTLEGKPEIITEEAS